MCPLKATTANQESWGAGDEEQNDADLKMSAGVAFLIVCSHYSTNWCAWSCWRLLAYLNSVCCLKLFHTELVAIGKKLKKILKKSFCFVLAQTMEAHYWETAWTLAAHTIHFWSHEAHYPFWETTGQDTTTCPLQSPQQQDLENSEVTFHCTWQYCSVMLLAKQAKRMRIVTM